jgi:hypothetical protein
MSTYGKKALAYWDYESKSDPEQMLTYNRTAKDMQLKILEKWYPIGMGVEKTSRGSEGHYHGDFTILKYVERGWGWMVEVISGEMVHPFVLRPNKAEIRERKLEVLGL